MANERIDPLFFGPQERRLFGCHHGPLAGSSAKLGVVLAPALGHEYSRAHRALQQLAQLVAAGGMRALRFDFGATGDSAGDEWPQSLASWGVDFEHALRELSLRTRVHRTALLGVRLSAALALDCASKNPACAALVLWDPVLDGAQYRTLLAQQQQRFEASLPAPLRESRAENAGLECLGHLWPQALLDSLCAWRAPSFERAPPTRILILESKLSPEAGALAAELSRGGSRVRHELSSGSQPWNEDVDRGLVPLTDLRTIVDFLREDA